MRRYLPAAVTLVLVGVFVLLSLKAVSFLTDMMGFPREAYASDWTAVFIIEHIRTTGEWPRGWGDLRDEYDRLAVPEFYAWTFDELQTLVDVDWDQSVAQIRDSGRPADYVRLTSGYQVNYAGDPDELIYDYIHNGNDPNQVFERIGAQTEGNGE